MRLHRGAALLLAALLLLCGGPSLAAQDVWMPPSFLPDDDAIGAAAADQLAPAIAAGGGALLAVWADKRAYPAGATTWFEYETSSDIFGMRLDANGNAMDLVPFAITQEAAAQENPQVVWNGTHWLVLFESTDVNGTGYYYQKSLEAVRVAPNGQVIDTTPIKIRNVSPVGGTWAAASDGVDWVVAFQSSASSSALQLLRITAAGTVVQPPRTIVGSTYYLRFDLKLAFAGGVYMLTWTDYSDTHALRFDPALNVLDAAPRTLVTGYRLSGVTASPSQFYAVWVTQTPSYTYAVTGTRVSTAGVALDGSGVNVSGSNQPQANTTTGVVWDGSSFRVSWGFANAVSLARVSPSGQVLDLGGVSVPGPSTGPAAATGTGGLQLVWSVYQQSWDQDVLGANISSSNTAGPNRVLSIGASAQTRADVASGGAGSMIVFRSDVSGVNRILAQPLDPAGNPLTPAPLLLDSGPLNNGPGAPSVAWNGSLYLASWGNASGIVAQRLAQDGTLVDAAPFGVMPGFGNTDVAALGGTFLIVARRFGYNPEIINCVGARVGGDGVVLDPSGFLVGSSYVIWTSVTSVGTRWLAAWRANVTHDNPAGATYAAFVEPNGTTPGEFPVYAYSSAGGNAISEVAVASNGSSALVLQSAELSSGVETDLIGVIVNASGSLQPPVNLTPWLGNQYSPRVAWNGTHYVVAYIEQRNRFALWTLDQLDARGDLYGMRVGPGGVPLDPKGFALSLSPVAETSPNVAAAGGVTLMTGSVMLGAPYDAYRVGYRLLGAGGNQWPVAVASATSAGGDVPLSVSFGSAGSGDPDGTLTSYAWDFGDGATSGAPGAVHTYTTPGRYVATLTVTDDDGIQSLNAVPVEVTLPNQSPVAVAAASPSVGPAPLSVTFTADSSYDPDGAIGNYEWTFSDDGSTYWGATAYHTFTQAGSHSATLKVFDNRGGTGTTVIGVTALPPGSSLPLAPSNLTYWVLTATSADLHWKDNSTNETGFVVERCVGTAAACNANPALYVPLPAVGANVDALFDSGLAGGTTYSWRVRAFNGVGSSGYSNTLSATLPTVPAAPTNLTARARSQTSGGGVKVSVVLNWIDNATTETGYTVERCAGASCGNFAAVAFLPPGSIKYTDQTVARKTTYRYRVTATGPGGQSPYSNVASATTR
jgi:PKD repeat protein